jgi:hypothetical protein
VFFCKIMGILFKVRIILLFVCKIVSIIQSLNNTPEAHRLSLQFFGEFSNFEILSSCYEVFQVEIIHLTVLCNSSHSGMPGGNFRFGISTTT